MSNEEQIKPQDIHIYLPSEFAEYYKAVEAKHFKLSEKSVGSRFLEASNLEELLSLTAQQRGDLNGDDRAKLATMGVPETALLSHCRYLIVETPGELGIINASELLPDSPIEVIRTKPNTPCSLVFRSTEFPETNLGLVIIGLNQKQSPDGSDPSTKEMVWTVHPGPPVQPASEDIWAEGSVITAQEVVDKLGPEYYVNVARPFHEVETET
ncbi:MAG: hypothetical protein WCP03_03910 [Candidatus Saccharibacteria bacterium]